MLCARLTLAHLPMYVAAKKLTYKVIEMAINKLAKMVKKRVMQTSAGKLLALINERVSKAQALVGKGMAIDKKYLKPRSL